MSEEQNLKKEEEQTSQNQNQEENKQENIEKQPEQQQQQQKEETSNKNEKSQEIDETKLKACDSCGKKQSKLLKCGGCKEVSYCEQACQKKHWKVHKENCAYYKKKELDNLPLYKGIDWFKMERIIGHGNFSCIWKAKCKKDDKYYAIKVIEKRKVKQINKEKDVEMEKYCLKKLAGNDYFIDCYGWFEDEQSLYIQLELVPGGELWNQSRIFGMVSINLVRYYLAHIVNAIEAMHAKGIVHRDLKAENIMITNSNKVKLIDFGTACDLQNPSMKGAGQGAKGKKNYEHFVGTPNYMAPEQIRNKGSFYATDIYCLSSVAYQMWGGFPAFNGGSEYLIFSESMEKYPVFPRSLYQHQPELKDLILGMGQKDIEKRLTIEQIKKHAFFKGIDFNNIPEYQHFGAMPMSKEDMFILDVKVEILANSAKFDENEKEYLEFFKKFKSKYENDPSLNNNVNLKERLIIMKEQGRVLIDSEQNIFDWKKYASLDDLLQGQEQEKEKDSDSDLSDGEIAKLMNKKDKKVDENTKNTDEQEQKQSEGSKNEKQQENTNEEQKPEAN